MTRDAFDFLSTVLWLAAESEKENEPVTKRWHVRDCTVHDVHPDMVAAVERFCGGFRDWLERRGFDSGRLDQLTRSFGGSTYFSLSGHGCGFWDENPSTDPELGDELHNLLREYSGNQHRFEELESSLYRHLDGKVHLHYMPAYLSHYLTKMFDQDLNNGTTKSAD